MTFELILLLKDLRDALLTMADAHLDAKLLMDVLCQMLGRIDGAMLASRATKGEHQRGEAALDISAHMSIGEFINRIEEGEYLTIVLQKSDDRIVQARQFLVWFIATWVVCRAAIKHIATTVAAFILGDALAVRETEDSHHQRSLSIVLREGGGSILRMGLIGVQFRRLIAIGTTGHSFYLLELGELRQLL